MEKLYDIKGFFTMGNNKNFDETNSWQGKILLKDDKQFEGIVVDSGDNTDRLITGSLIDYQVAILDKFNLKGYDPCSFISFSDGNEFRGQYFAVTPSRGEIPAGNCKIQFTYTEENNEVKNILEKRIESFKDKVSGFNKFLYEQTLIYKDANYSNMEANLNISKAQADEILGVKVKKYTLPNKPTQEQ